MKYFIRKIFIFLTFSLMTSMGYAYESYDNYSDCGENCFSCEPVCCDSCGTLLLSAGLIYWRAFENGLDTCISSRSSNTVLDDGTVISKMYGNSRDPDFEWNPGFRIGVGYEFACSNWDAAVFWTHFNSTSHGHKNKENHIRWNLDFDVVDVIGAYDFNFSPCFTLSPFGGIRGAIIDQKLHNGDFSDSPHFFTKNEDIEFGKNRENFWGVGPLVGLEGDWNVGCGFSLYANGSVSWLYGKFDVQFVNGDRSGDTLDICNERKNLNAITTALDAEIGIRWATCLCNDMEFILQFGLEHHQYFNFNRIGYCGDLSFDGFNLTAGITF